MISTQLTERDMNFFPPRLLRLETEYQVKVALQEKGRGALLQGKRLPGVMVNFSKRGACLVLSKVMLEGKHLFFTTLNSDQYYLELMIESSERGNEHFAIPATSVWMDSCSYKRRPAFKIGLRFHESQKQLFRIFKR